MSVTRRLLPMAATTRTARLFVPLAVAAACLFPATCQAQFGRGFGGGVGGISIDADGIVRNLDARAVGALAAERSQAIADAGWKGKAGDSRKVSLKAVGQAVEEFAAKGTPVPLEIAFLGGLQRIEHVFVDPDGHDIILAGPADAITIDTRGNAVGATNRRPLLHLEDLVVALRAIDAARAGGMQCSIDPTPEGIARLQDLLRRQTAMAGNPQALFAEMEKAVGPQRVTVGGVPGESRFARVLVAADYRLKRLGMGIEESGLEALPSYLEMVPAAGRSTQLPRFWLEAEYDPIARDADELAWRIGGRRMKCLTESDIAGRDGIKRGAAPADKIAGKWCDAMTTNYDALAAKQPVFAELVNCVDLAVVAALIHGRQLDARAGCDLAALRDPEKLPLPKYEVPTQIPTVATGMKKGTSWVLSASGGVKFQPWAFASATREDATVAAARQQALAARPAAGTSWD
jgi:hypothetical protein